MVNKSTVLLAVYLSMSSFKTRTQ